MGSLGSGWRFTAHGSSSSGSLPPWHGVCWWIFLPQRWVVGSSTQSGWCSNSVAGSRKVLLAVERVVVYAASVAACFASSPSDLLSRF
ncbi:hypothetical protein YC2023_093495 [Brassica napus]